MVHCKEAHLLIYLLITELTVLFLSLTISLCFMLMAVFIGFGMGCCLMGCFEVTMVFMLFLGSDKVF